MDKIKVSIFHTGKVRVDQAIPLHEHNPLAVTGLFRSKKKPWTGCWSARMTHPA